VDIVEREEQLAALEAWFAEAGSGAGRLVLVAGEAGIGKSSLVRAFCERHRDDARVWWGACDALSTPRPLGPLHDIARTARGRLRALMAEEVSRHDRFSGFLDALAWPLQPTIAVIEDVHWADDATRDLLLFIARRASEVNALIVVTYRDDEVGAGHPLRRVLGSVATLPGVARLSVMPLSEAGIAMLAAGRVADVGELVRLTGGNAFFVTEVLAAGQRVPTTVSDAVLARVATVPSEARAVAEAAAVVPDQVELELLRQVIGDASHAVDACLDAGLLVEDGRSLRFRHELARLAVEDATPRLRRVALHAGVLRALLATKGADPARITYHAERSGDRSVLLAYAPVAALQASALGAHREAVAHLERILPLLDELPAEERAKWLEWHADECMAIDREAEALRSYDGAVAAWARAGDDERRAAVLARHAYALWGVGRNAEARVVVQEAVAILESRPPGLALATAYTYSAHLHMLAREIASAIDLGRRAVAIAEEHDDVALIARASNIVGAAEWFVDPDQAERTLARALDAAHRSGDDTIVGIVLRMLGSGAGEVRRYATADRWLRAGVDWCAEHDLDIHGGYCLAWAARTALEQGRWAEAADKAEHVVGRDSEHAPTRIVALTALGRLRVRRGEVGGSELLAEAWRIAATTGDLQRLWPAAAGRAEAAWLAGSMQEIPDLVGDTFALARRLAHGWALGELGFWLWRAGALDRGPEGAAQPFAHQIEGDWRGAASAWEALGCPYETAVALADGDDPALVTRALEVFGRLGAAPMADRVTASLRRRGVRQLPRRPSRTTVDNPGGLTDRQLDVLRLLVKGDTNGQIAARLHISPKTVGHHVSAILERLGVEDRREAARVARDRGLTPTERRDGQVGGSRERG
jgi:DNA-binding CsgD family transcriptional regulator/tetratricopeptide (TPR) repeat protein